MMVFVRGVCEFRDVGFRWRSDGLVKLERKDVVEGIALRMHYSHMYSNVLHTVPPETTVPSQS